MTLPILSAARSILGVVGADPARAESVRVTGPPIALESSFDVTTAAATLVATSSLAVADLASARFGERAVGVEVNTAHACAAFRSERHLRVSGAAPALWDPLAGYYETADGFVQFHTNFDHHRAAVLQTLGLPETTDRAVVQAAVRSVGRLELERAITDAGGVAAALRTEAEWSDHPHRPEVEHQPPVARSPVPGGRTAPLPTGGTRPLEGIRVLDLTRVLAGPVCTRILAAYGADVLRVGAADLPVVTSVLPDTTLGKRFCHLDLRTPAGRDRLFTLAADADVVVSSFRPGALDSLGVGRDELFDVRPELIVAELSAFGTSGPWGHRRGFDSITQTATGLVAAETAYFASERPRPLPCQLLDHGTGHLLALGVLRSLLERHEGAPGQFVECSLLATRNWLTALGRVDAPPTEAGIDDFVVARDTAFGPIAHVTHPGRLDGIDAAWSRGPSTPGADPPVWA